MAATSNWLKKGELFILTNQQKILRFAKTKCSPELTILGKNNFFENMLVNIKILF